MGVPTALVALHAVYFGRWIPDDAGISFAYARSLATGAGPVLQPGVEPVEGFSNPAWVAVLTVGRWLGLFDHATIFGVPDIVMFPKLVALGCCAGIFAAMFAIADAVTDHPVPVTVAAGAATATVPSFVIWVVSGLENALYALVIVAIAAVLATAAAGDRLYATRTCLIVGLLGGLAALTRPDGVVYLAVMPIAAVLHLRKRLGGRAIRAVLLSAAAFAVPAVSYVGWRLLSFGDYLPNTARAKRQDLVPAMSDLAKLTQLGEYVGIITVAIGAVIVAVGLTRPSVTRTAVAMVLVVLTLAIASFVILEPDWMAQLRFATPVWPLAAIAFALSCVEVIGRTDFLVRAVVMALVLLAVVAPLARFNQWDREFRAHPTVDLCRVALSQGYLFNGFADILGIRDGSLLSPDAGGTAMASRLRFVDLAGLADRRIARLWQNDDMPGLRDYVLDTVQPTFVILFAGWSERTHLGLTDDPRFVRDYLLMFSADLGGGEWVRRDAVPRGADVDALQRWGRRNWDLVAQRYSNHIPPLWTCGDTLRPTDFRDGSPALSPLTTG